MSHPTNAIPKTGGHWLHAIATAVLPEKVRTLGNRLVGSIRSDQSYLGYAWYGLKSVIPNTLQSRTSAQVVNQPDQPAQPAARRETLETRVKEPSTESAEQHQANTQVARGEESKPTTVFNYLAGWTDSIPKGLPQIAIVVATLPLVPGVITPGLIPVCLLAEAFSLVTMVGLGFTLWDVNNLSDPEQNSPVAK